VQGQHVLAREPPDEEDRWYWLQWAGVTRNGVTAAG